MGSFGITKTKISCPHCGKEYIEIEQKQPMRERGTFKCYKCKGVIRSWNGGVDFDYHEVPEDE